MTAVEKLTEKRIADAYFITSKYNVRYLTDFTGTDSEVLLAGGSTILFTDSRYAEQAANEVPAGVQIVVTGAHERMDTVRTALFKNAPAELQLGLEEDELSMHRFREIMELCPGCESVNISHTLLEMRCRKTAREMDWIRTAAAATDEVMEAIAHVLRPGVSEFEVAAHILYETVRRGMEPSFDPIVAGGPNGAMPHAAVSNYRLKEGDLVTLDFGCRYRGYCADMTRTLGIGHIDGQLKTIYDIVEQAQKRAENAAAVGISARAVDDAARSYIRDAGYGENFGHGTGHGVGLQIHELPIISPRSDAVLEEGMAFTVEPGIYVPGLGGVRIEDTCIAGIGNLFRFPKNLIELH